MCTYHLPLPPLSIVVSTPPTPPSNPNPNPGPPDEAPGDKSKSVSNPSLLRLLRQRAFLAEDVAAVLGPPRLPDPKENCIDRDAHPTVEPVKPPKSIGKSYLLQYLIGAVLDVYLCLKLMLVYAYVAV